jgi:transglutaminase-like putative cysteine protease
VSTAFLMLATAVAALLFAPVFGWQPLLLPVGVPAVVLLAVALASGRRAALVAWRPLLVAGAGVLAVAEVSLWPTTVAGLPTGRTLRALAAGVTDSWQLALQSTWPARPEPDLLLFVPLLVVLAGVLGIEALHRVGPLPALAPSLAVALLSQLFAPLAAGPATVAALGYAAAAGALLVAAQVPEAVEPTGSRRRRVTAAVPAAALAAVAAVLAGLVVPADPARYSLRQRQPAPVAQTPVTSPLDEIAYRLDHPGVATFRVRDAVGVDRWPLVVLDTFDGVNWTSSDRYRRMGADLRPSPAVTARVRSRSADIEVTGLDGPWLPSQTWPAGVRGVAPLVEERHGTLLLPGGDGGARYTLTWWQPEVDAAALGTAGTDTTLSGGLGGVGPVPPGVADLAERAVRGMRPSFRAALALERHLRENYRTAVGDDLPTGHTWPQLADFLLRGRRGTSEQFAAAYVALARILGIPARLVVGFRAPAARDPDGGYTVRNGDVLAWPEVAVADAGWVPLDPSGAASAGAATPGGGLAAVTAQARSRLPAPEDLRDPPVARPGPRGPRGGDAPPWATLLGVPAVLLAVWLLGVPAAKAGRAWRRRRRPGTGAVVGAWEEVRDRLREHGVAVSAGMTVRDLAAAAASLTDQATVDGLRRLRSTVDSALWSAAVPEPAHGREAWSAVRAVRRGLARRGWRARLRAGLDPRSLLPP